jgi:hypothetical protein
MVGWFEIFSSCLFMFYPFLEFFFVVQFIIINLLLLLFHSFFAVPCSDFEVLLAVPLGEVVRMTNLPTTTSSSTNRMPAKAPPRTPGVPVTALTPAPPATQRRRRSHPPTHLRRRI